MAVGSTSSVSSVSSTSAADAAIRARLRQQLQHDQQRAAVDAAVAAQTAAEEALASAEKQRAVERLDLQAAQRRLQQSALTAKRERNSRRVPALRRLVLAAEWAGRLRALAAWRASLPPRAAVPTDAAAAAAEPNPAVLLGRKLASANLLRLGLLVTLHGTSAACLGAAAMARRGGALALDAVCCARLATTLRRAAAMDAARREEVVEASKLAGKFALRRAVGLQVFPVAHAFSQWILGASAVALDAERQLVIELALDAQSAREDLTAAEGAALRAERRRAKQASAAAARTDDSRLIDEVQAERAAAEARVATLAREKAALEGQVRRRDLQLALKALAKERRLAAARDQASALRRALRSADGLDLAAVLARWAFKAARLRAAAAEPPPTRAPPRARAAWAVGEKAAFRGLWFVTAARLARAGALSRMLGAWSGGGGARRRRRAALG